MKDVGWWWGGRGAPGRPGRERIRGGVGVDEVAVNPFTNTVLKSETANTLALVVTARENETP